MNIGKLNRLVTIQSLTQTKDSSGGMLDSWSTVSDVWAQVSNLSGNEKKLTAYGGQVGEARTEFVIRYLAGITHKNRISYNGSYYNIKHVNNWNERNEILIITCDTGVNDGR